MESCVLSYWGRFVWVTLNLNLEDDDDDVVGYMDDDCIVPSSGSVLLGLFSCI